MKKLTSVFTLCSIFMISAQLLLASNPYELSDSYVVMTKKITNPTKCVPLPQGFTLSAYDQTNILFIADQIAPLFNDDQAAYQAGLFNPHGKGTQLVFKDNATNKICGYAAFSIHKNDLCADIQQLIIDKDYQRRGLASTFLKHIESHAAAYNCTFLELWVRENNDKAIELYKKQGFTNR